jgi:hypothetical protein
VGKFPAIIFIFSPQLTKLNSKKNQKNGTNNGLTTTAPFPPNLISMNCSCPPPSSRNLISFAKKSPILATSWCDAYQGDAVTLPESTFLLHSECV